MKNLELILYREGRSIRVCAAGEPKQTLKQFEDKIVDFERVDKLCDSILSILNRANKSDGAVERLISDLKKSGQDLFDELLPEKAKNSLLQTSCDTLSLDIDDRLIHIPWELLYDGEQFLCRKFSIGRIVSTKQNIPRSQYRKMGPSLRMLIIADPKKDLEAAYNEGIKIRDELVGWEDTIKVHLVSSRVDIQYVRQYIRDYDIVHYTGHAEYDKDDPSGSGWVMSDGIWTVSDIKAIQGDTPFPFLIFANACHSGRAEKRHVGKEYEKEVYDLANTFLHCGVTHYIGTFLEIPDSPSSIFAVEFYKAISKDVSVGEAVRTARERLAERYGETSIIWASYMLYGDPAYKIPYKSKLPVTETKRASKIYITIAVMVILMVTYFMVSRESSGPDPHIEQHVPLAVSFTDMAGINGVSGADIREILTEGSRIYVFEKIQFHFKSNRDVYFLLVTKDNHGKFNLLFNDRASFVNHSPAEKEHLLSVDAHLFKFDEAQTPEAIYILASESKLLDIEPVLWEIERLNEQVESEQNEAPENSAEESAYKVMTRINIRNGKLHSIITPL
jgi:CHAT domain-containing protein